MELWQREHKHWTGEYWSCPRCDSVPSEGPYEDNNACMACVNEGEENE